MVSSIPTADLDQRCANETDKFTRQQPNDPQWCFELLRRALAERDVDAFTYVYRTYEVLVLSWVRHHSCAAANRLGPEAVKRALSPKATRPSPRRTQV